MAKHSGSEQANRSGAYWELVLHSAMSDVGNVDNGGIELLRARFRMEVEHRRRVGKRTERESPV